METDKSDHHALIFSFLKSTFTKMPSNKLQYRNYKQSDASPFLQDAEQLYEKIKCTEWQKDFVKTLNKHASFKIKEIRENHKLFIAKNWERQSWNDQLWKRGQISQIIRKWWRYIKNNKNYVANFTS